MNSKQRLNKLINIYTEDIVRINCKIENLKHFLEMLEDETDSNSIRLKNELLNLLEENRKILDFSKKAKKDLEKILSDRYTV